MASTIIPQGSTVLVTGATGHIGSGIANKILEAGYKVIAAVRNPEKAAITTEAFHKRYGKDKFSTVLIKDLGAPGALDEALQGCSGVVHAASDISYGTNPAIVTNTVAMAKNIAQSAAKSSSIKRFVYTSSNQTLSLTTYTKQHITPASWNEESVEALSGIKADDPWSPLNARHVYSASKVLSEKALWDFVKEEKPGFILNSVCPNFTIGSNLDPRLISSTNGVIAGVASGKEQAVATAKMVLPQFYIGLDDVAFLHLAGLTMEDVKNERLIGLVAPLHFNDMVDVINKVNPDAKLERETTSDGKACLATVDMTRSKEVLRDIANKDFTSIEGAIVQCLSTLQ